MIESRLFIEITKVDNRIYWKIQTHIQVVVENIHACMNLLIHLCVCAVLDVIRFDFYPPTCDAQSTTMRTHALFFLITTSASLVQVYRTCKLSCPVDAAAIVLVIPQFIRILFFFPISVSLCFSSYVSRYYKYNIMHTPELLNFIKYGITMA